MGGVSCLEKTVKNKHKLAHFNWDHAELGMHECGRSSSGNVGLNLNEVNANVQISHNLCDICIHFFVLGKLD